MNKYLEGNTIRLECSPMECGGSALVAASFTCQVKVPGGSVVTVSPVQQDGSGVFALYLPTAGAGTYTYKFKATDPVGMAKEGQFEVDASAIP